MGNGGSFPVYMFGRLVHADAVAQLFEILGVMRFRAMEMLRLGDELHAVIPWNAGLAQDTFKWFQIAGIHHEQLVLVKLHFHRSGRIDHRYAGAAAIEQKIFDIAAIAYEHRQIALLAYHIVVARALVGWAGSQP